MTYFQTSLEFDNQPAFLVRNVINKDGTLSMDLHDPISPNASQKFMKDLRTEKFFSFRLVTLDSVGLVVLSKEFQNVELLYIDFEKFHSSSTEESSLNIIFKS